MPAEPAATSPPDVTAAIPRRPGRPRRLGSDEERQALLDAALEVLRRNDYAEVTVADLLAEAGLSSRSFYRHFETKDHLLAALFRRDAERAAARLAEIVAAAPDAASALDGWVTEILSFGYDPARVRRVALLGSAAATAGNGLPGEVARAGSLLVAPLVDVLSRGRADGTFPRADPVEDAAVIQAVAWSAAGLTGAPRRHPDLDAARAAVLSFCRRALGAA